MIIERLSGSALDAALDGLAKLRIDVFRAWPYLYDGDASYERRYLQSYQENSRAVLIVARNGDDIVGAATGMPLGNHADAVEMVGDLPAPISDIFYCAESVLLPQYRGQGIGHAFFDQREAEARSQGFQHSLFAGVVRPDDHPLRPSDYRPLHGFWRKRGYALLPGVTATFHWTDVGDFDETPHTLQAWSRAL
ncbi:MAG: GNAT family N-acetyltransferase [Marinovum sp.]|nr:GNAT family N-acetyltransferase [Marinovum sp.]